MRIDQQIAEASAEYERRWGDVPDRQWYEGDDVKWLDMIRKCLKANAPLPDYFAAKGLPSDALT